MPHAHRHHLSGCIWYLTHWCCQRTFVLKFAHDLWMAARDVDLKEVSHGLARRETSASYMARSEAGMPVPRAQNTLPWRIAS